ncbi:MAG: TfoX/Sxy family protein [Parvibaculum sp.]|uniref:TfoX/Sxy family protein n=1 Tax=Parvibaculum sp. TaxID=2024848 RepID=UPI002728B9D4|nr:TfoX/Sxy family protein [Parvibaculum sp.]MDO8838163.1 TfoX/Sxy family protein [Parvibaculum sp.]MDP2123332.1 TfoX/Sxy family protein [Parvibaculum sp.]MDZ4368240.1 TfoX/Sxy family protein [Afipia sp.]
MAVSDEYKEFVAEQLEHLGPIRIRNMFGGAGIYLDNLMFGLIAGETLFFKVDERNRADYEAEDSGPFVYEPPSGKTVAMSYYELPERLYDEPDELILWARKALDAALAARAAKPVPRKSRSPRKKAARPGK